MANNYNILYFEQVIPNLQGNTMRLLHSLASRELAICQLMLHLSLHPVLEIKTKSKQNS